MKAVAWGKDTEDVSFCAFDVELDDCVLFPEAVALLDPAKLAEPIPMPDAEFDDAEKGDGEGSGEDDEEDVLED